MASRDPLTPLTALRGLYEETGEPGSFREYMRRARRALVAAADKVAEGHILAATNPGAIGNPSSLRDAMMTVLGTGPVSGDLMDVADVWRAARGLVGVPPGEDPETYRPSLGTGDKWTLGAVGAGAALPFVSGATIRRALPAGARRGMPEHSSAGASVQMDEGGPPRVTPPPTWYSRLEQAIERAPFNAAPGRQWDGYLRKAPGGVPEMERQWTDLADLFSDGQQRVTRDRALSHVRERGIRLGETVLGRSETERALNMNSTYLTPSVRRIVTADQGAAPDALLMTLENDGDAYRELTKKFPDLADMEDWAEVVLKDIVGTRNKLPAPKFAQYTEPGGQNYREILIQLDPNTGPMPEVPADWKVVAPGETFSGELRGRGTHAVDSRYHRVFDSNGDLLAYGDNPEDALRQAAFDERGVGRRPEFTQSHWDQPNVLTHLRVNDRTYRNPATGRDEKVLFIEELQSDWHQKGRERGYRGDENPERLATLQAKSREGTLTAEEDTELTRLINSQSPVPNAPFKKTDEWVELGLKRAIKEAVDNGYDRVAWANGRMSADRYDLRKQVSALRYDPEIGTLRARDLNGEEVLNVQVPPEKLADHIGKEPARRILERVEQQKTRITDFNTAKSSERGALASELETSGKNAQAEGWQIEKTREYGTGQFDYTIRRPDGTNAAWLSGSYLPPEQALGSHLTGKRLPPSHAAEYRPPKMKAVVIKGDDLAVGGEGMMAFYDNIVPKVAQKYTKGIGGGAVEPVNLGLAGGGVRIERKRGGWLVTDRTGGEGFYETRSHAEEAARDLGWKPDQGGEVMSFPITQAMRDNVFKGGQRLGASTKTGTALAAGAGAAGMTGLAALKKLFEERDRE